MKRLLLFAVTLIAVGCGAAEEEFASKERVAELEVAKPLPSEEDRDRTTDSDVQQQRHVIYNAEIDLEVSEFSEFRKILPAMVIRFGGYISDVKIDQYQVRESKEVCRSGKWQLKIKSTEFEKFVVELSQVGLVVRHHQTAKDMTSEFVDLGARITNKKRMEARVLDLITESKRSLNDVVSLERELSRIRGEIERMQGRLNYIRNRTEFSTLTIMVREHADVAEIAVSPFTTRIASAWNQSIRLLKLVVSNLLVFATYVLPWVIVLLIVGLPAIWLFRRLRLRWGLRPA